MSMGEKKGKELAPSPTTIQYDSSEIKKEARKSPEYHNKAVDSSRMAVSLAETEMQKKSTGRRTLEKLLCLEKKKERLTAYWNSNMSEDEKENVLTVNVKELMAYYNTLKEKLAHQVLSQAFCFAEDHHNWMFWICCECGEAFSDSGLHFQHVVESHAQGVSSQESSVLPYEIDQDWISMIRSGTWKPINMSKAVIILKNRWEEVSNLKLSKNETRHWARSQIWPLSDDSDRVESLERIQVLLKNIHFAKEHLSLVIKFTMKRLHDNHPGLRLYEVGLNETHFCICMLGASEIGRICTFFGELHELSKTHNSDIPEIVTPRPVNQIKERMILDGDSLCLLLDEQSLQGESSSVTYLLDSDRRDRGRPSSDALLSWIFSGLSIEEELESWVQIEKDNRCCGKKLLQTLKKTYQSLEKICAAKQEKLSYKEALKDIGGLCLQEVNKRKCSAEYVPQRLEEVLWKRLKELVVQKKSDSGKNKSEFDVISSLLAQEEDVTQEQTRINSAITCMCDFNTLTVNDVTSQIYLDQDDMCLLEAIERARKSAEYELIKYDWIMPTGIDIWPFAANDYRAILLTLVKSYIQAQLEKLVYKDTEDKSYHNCEKQLKIEDDVKHQMTGGRMIRGIQRPKNNVAKQMRARPVTVAWGKANMRQKNKPLERYTRELDMRVTKLETLQSPTARVTGSAVVPCQGSGLRNGVEENQIASCAIVPCGDEQLQNEMEEVDSRVETSLYSMVVNLPLFYGNFNMLKDMVKDVPKLKRVRPYMPILNVIGVFAFIWVGLLRMYRAGRRRKRTLSRYTTESESQIGISNQDDHRVDIPTPPKIYVTSNALQEETKGLNSFGYTSMYPTLIIGVVTLLPAIILAIAIFLSG